MKILVILFKWKSYRLRYFDMRKKFVTSSEQPEVPLQAFSQTTAVTRKTSVMTTTNTTHFLMWTSTVDSPGPL